MMAAPDLGFTHLWRPAEPGETRTLLLLHGTGGDENDLVSLAPMIAPGAAILSPRGRVLEQGMPRWFRRLAPGVFDEADLRARTAELAEFVTHAAGHYGFDAARLAAVGFSNGANIAAALLLLGYDVPRQAVLLRAMVPLVPLSLPNLTGRRVLLAAGKSDPMAGPGQPEKLASMLSDAGATVETHWSNAGHELTESDVRAAEAFLSAQTPPSHG